jgi:hypothetical protein
MKKVKHKECCSQIKSFVKRSKYILAVIVGNSDDNLALGFCSSHAFIWYSCKNLNQTNWILKMAFQFQFCFFSVSWIRAVTLKQINFYGFVFISFKRYRYTLWTTRITFASLTNPQLVGKGRKIVIPVSNGRKTSWKDGIPDESILFPPLKRPSPALNLVEYAIYPRMHKLPIRADFDGKWLNKKYGRIHCFLTKRIIKVRSFPPDPGLVRLLRLFPTFDVHSDIGDSCE